MKKRIRVFFIILICIIGFNVPALAPAQPEGAAGQIQAAVSVEPAKSLEASPIVPIPAVSASKADYLPVLVYHHLAPARLNLHQKNPMMLPVETFRQHMEYLKKQDYYTPTLAEVEAYVAGKASLPEKSVLITFDDGYESNYHYAHPILTELGMKAVVFIIGTAVRMEEGGSFNPSAVSYLSWEQVLAMQNSKVWEIGSHTWNGHRKNGETPIILTWNESEASADFTKLNKQLSTNNMPAPTAIAYPYGAYGTAALSAAASSGIRLGFTVEKGFIRPGDQPLELPRQGVFPWHKGEKFVKLLTP